MPVQQTPSIVLPQVWVIGNEVEVVADLVTHPSVEVLDYPLEYKQVHIMAIEMGVGVPGNLLCWIELSPVLSTTSPNYWSAIGGGGGPIDPATGLPYFPPVAPLVEVALGVAGTIHTMLLPWVIHSRYARLVVQTPVAAALPGAFWWVQAIYSAQAP